MGLSQGDGVKTAVWGDLFGQDGAPQGFRYLDDLISPAEETALVAAFQRLAFAPFQFHQYQGNRRVVSYGFKYDYSAQRMEETDPLPEFLQPLREKAASFAGLAPAAFAQCLVTEYAPGAGIGWHRDKPVFADVAGISFLAPCTLRFRRMAEGKYQRFNLRVLPRSAYLLHGPARHEWHHSIPVMTELRYSVTFRSLAA
jgi:alkylated DNA repair dioxygenase AlkB